MTKWPRRPNEFRVTIRMECQQWKCFHLSVECLCNCSWIAIDQIQCRRMAVRQPATGNWQLAIRLVRESFSIKLSNLLRLPSGRKPLRDTARSSNDARSSSTPSTPEYHSISTAIDYRFPTFLLFLLIPSRCRLSPSPFFSIQRVAGRHFVATLTIPLLPLSLLHFPTSPKHWATNIEQCAN